MNFTDIWHRYGHRPYRLHTKKEGSGPVIIFLHGIGSSSANWNNLIPLLKTTHTCITIDLLGFGESAKPGWSEYRIDDHLKSINYTIQKLALDEPYILVGHSLGGLLACRYATTRAGSKLAKLIMISPPVYLHPSQHKSALVKNATNAYLRLYQFMRSHKKFTMRNFALVAKYFPGTGVINLNESTWHAFRSTLENCIENQTTITDFAHVDIPVDIVYGTLDQFIIQPNITYLGKLSNVTVTKVKGASHVIKPMLARAVANIITTEKT